MAAKAFVIKIKIGMDNKVLKIKTFTTSQKFRPIFVFTKIIPVSDINTSWVIASTQMKTLEASDTASLINKAGRYISAKPATDAGAMAKATSLLYPINV